jgi:non-specific serine/threonine protein kinase
MELFDKQSEQGLSDTTEIVLTPNFSLIFPQAPAKQEWPESLFALGASRSQESLPGNFFWKNFAASFLQCLSRLPENLSPTQMEPPQAAELEGFVGNAPPMPGGEYLSQAALSSVWDGLCAWVAKSLKGRSISEFFQERAPAWRRVGRLTFHLAENKASEDFPFAFMVTYVPSLTVEGIERHAPIIKAIKFYADKSDKSELVRLLSPVKEASERLPWVRDLDKDGKLYSPQLWGTGQAYRFLLDVPALEESGLSVRIPDWWRRRPKASVKVTVGESKAATLGLDSIIDWDVRLAIGDQDLSRKDINELLRLAKSEGLVLFKGQWIEAKVEELEKALGSWEEAKLHASSEGISFLQAMRLVSGLPADDLGKRGPRLPELGPSVRIEPGAAFRELLGSLKDLEESSQPPELAATLRPYQKEGLSWLLRLTALGLGGCLADDMGLGKTIQVLALLLKDKARRKKLDPGSKGLPSLLVAPASLMANWRLEARRFAPTLRVSTFHPSETPRERLLAWEANPEELASGADLVVTSYSIAARSFDFLKNIEFRLVILDEAQAIKNPGTNQSRAVRGLRSASRLALTGTPIENRLGDLWSIYDFLNPGLLGSHKRFKDMLSQLQGREDHGYAPLRQLISPYLLRRLKSDKRIIDDLPDKVETVLHCQLTKEQTVLYQRVVNGLKKNLDQFGGSGADGIRRRGAVLQGLMRLKQLINHPSQLTGDFDWAAEKSGKFMRLAELGRELAERQERILVFTQYKEIIGPLANHLAGIFGRPGLVLHGSTPVKARQRLVEDFQRPNGPPFFVISLKAGGTGLNLTEAGHVIHFDRWWNPAVENQATDRAFRIGQKKNVVVHKFITLGTIEEKIDAMLEEKQKMANDVIAAGAETWITEMNDAELLNLFKLEAKR